MESNNNSDLEPKKKKRGRKPLSESQKKPVEKVYKKRGRKPKNLEEPKIDNTQLVQNNEQIILHLPINSTGNEDDPTPYDELEQFSTVSPSSLENSNGDGKLFININSIAPPDKDISNIIDELREKRQQEINHTNNFNDKYSYIFMDYVDTNKTHVWPSKSKIDCLWDCHPFDSTPCGIPIKKEGEVMTMFGNFCCPECAAAYNFDSNIASDEMWERYSLLNMLYSKDGKEVKLALPRLALKKFGGPFTISEWRNHNPNRNYKITMPPVTAVIPTLEEITIDTDDSLFKGISSDFINKTSNELRLKRTKPLPNYKNTLENCMNLKYI